MRRSAQVAFMRYTEGMADSPVPGSRDYAPTSLRAEQVAQTRAALVAAGRLLFGTKGFAATSVEDIARTARVTTGALYHHFPTKAALFEAVFEQVHAEMLVASAEATEAADGALAQMTAGFGVFLDQVLEPEVQRILVTDGPAVLGLARFIELDEKNALQPAVEMLEAANAAGLLQVDDPATLIRLLFGAMTRAGLLIASSPDPQATRDAVGATFRQMLSGFLAGPG
jgi:AcrR family transcriptional regulator